MATGLSNLRDLDDAELVRMLRDGDQSAFSELYDRYFDAVYDFLARMMRNRAEAEDVAQDTFLRAVTRIESLRNAASFKSWIFTIARNTALHRIERSRRTQPLAYSDREAEHEFDIVDSSQFNSPEEAAKASATAALVWEAAAGLSSKQYSILDLHLRQGLESAEIADVLGITRNNAYVMVNRLKNAVEESIGAYIMIRQGRNQCEDLDARLREANIRGISPEARRLVTSHVAECETCQQTQKDLVSPTAILGAFVPASAAPGLKEAVLNDSLAQMSGVPPSSTAHSQPTARIPLAPATAGHNLILLSAGAIAMLIGLVMVILAITNPFEADAEPVESGPGGATLIFQTEDGSPVAGVSVTITHTGDDGETEQIEQTTGGSGTLELTDRGPGDYAVTITGLPPEYQPIEATRISEFSVDEGEQVEITGVFRFSGE